MRIGVFSDIHANLEAFQAVVRAYNHENIDRYLCAGDVVGYGGSPGECMDLALSLTEEIVLGNHDAAVGGLMDYSYYYEAARKVLDLHAMLLSGTQLERLRKLPYSRQYPELGIQLCHGSPANLEEFDYLFAPEHAYALLPHFDQLAPVTFIGHSHLCRVFALTPNTVEEIGQRRFSLDKERKFVISVGSVGQPRDYDNRASYTIFDTEKRAFYFKRVEYDIEAAAAKIFEAKLERNFGNRLFIGV